MTKTAKTWTKPELIRLGKIDQVASNTSAACQKTAGGSGNCNTFS